MIFDFYALRHILPNFCFSFRFVCLPDFVSQLVAKAEKRQIQFVKWNWTKNNRKTIFKTNLKSEKLRWVKNASFRFDLAPLQQQRQPIQPTKKKERVEIQSKECDNVNVYAAAEAANMKPEYTLFFSSFSVYGANQLYAKMTHWTIVCILVSVLMYCLIRISSVQVKCNRVILFFFFRLNIRWKNRKIEAEEKSSLSHHIEFVSSKKKPKLVELRGAHTVCILWESLHFHIACYWIRSVQFSRLSQPLNISITRSMERWNLAFLPHSVQRMISEINLSIKSKFQIPSATSICSRLQKKIICIYIYIRSFTDKKKCVCFFIFIWVYTLYKYIDFLQVNIFAALKNPYVRYTCVRVCERIQMRMLLMLRFRGIIHLHTHTHTNTSSRTQSY